MAILPFVRGCWNCPLIILQSAFTSQSQHPLRSFIRMWIWKGSKRNLFTDFTLNADTITSSNCSSSEILAWESLACYCDSPTTHTPRATFPLLVLTSYVSTEHSLLSSSKQAYESQQKIRTIELDGKTVKLQIVSFNIPLPPDVENPNEVLYSGTQLVKNVSAPSPHPTTEARMVSVWSTMSRTWIRSTT